MFDAQTVLERLKSQSESSCSIAVLVDQYIEHSYKHDSLWTVRPRASHLKHLVSFCTAAQITMLDKLSYPVLNTFFEMYGENRKLSTVMALRRTIKSFSNWLIEYKEIYPAFSPQAIKVKKIRSKPKALDLNLVLMVIKKSELEDSLIIQTFLESGIRIAELCRIRVCDIKNCSISIVGKGNKERTVYISQELKERIDDFCGEYERYGNDHLFQKNHGWHGHLSTKNARERIQRSFKKIAGIHMTPHQLRHTFAIEMLKAKCNPMVIKKLLGHEHFSTTEIYLTIVDNYASDEYQRHIEEVQLNITGLTNSA